MPQTTIDLKPPRIARHPAIQVAGLAQRYGRDTKGEIPALWQRFAPHIGNVPGELIGATYGICHKYQPDGSFEYICGVQVAGSHVLPAGLTTMEIPSKVFAVFSHTGHISTIPATWQAIFGEWLPSSGCTLEQEPNFERYTDAFDPRSGFGLVEIWIPLKAGTAA